MRCIPRISSCCSPSAKSSPDPCRSCRRLRSFDLQSQSQKIAAFGSSYRGSAFFGSFPAMS
ncbi:hypothetical protein DMX04_24100 [Pseudomonas koreensis]|nr:hypothetical protein DMX04_24100 [Pseudomonas koreensis]